MCGKCMKLMGTKIGYKTKVKITENTEMILDRYKDHFEVFIHSSDVDRHDGSWLNYPFDIKHCPFCGCEIKPFEEE